MELSEEVMRGVLKLGMMREMPIMMDYWEESKKGKVFIGVKSEEEKLLVKNSEEYTSPIKQMYKINEAFIVLTENSIYLVSNDIKGKNIAK